MNSEEKILTQKILNQMSTTGDSGILNDLWSEDFEEIPVSIDEFIENDKYLGKTTNNGKAIYPFWRERLREIFDKGTHYHECISGNTLVHLLNGSTRTIKELYESGSTEYVYSYDLDTNMYTVGKFNRIVYKGCREVYRVDLDNGKSFVATGDHPVLMRNKHYKNVKDLSPDDSLMPFNLGENDRGYELIYHPQKDGSFIEEPTHRMSKRWKQAPFNLYVTHHKDYNKHNNDPTNLCASTWMTHRMFHAHHINKLMNETGIALRKMWEDPNQHIRAAKRTVLYNKTSHPHLLKTSKSELIDALSSSYSLVIASNKLGISRTGLWDLIDKYGLSDSYRSYLIKSPFNLPNKYWGPKLSMLSEIYKSNNNHIDDSLVHGKTPKPSRIIHKYYNDDPTEFYELLNNYNHKVIKITKLPDPEDVYDFQIDGPHNLALDCGIVVSNCIFTGSIGRRKLS